MEIYQRLDSILGWGKLSGGVVGFEYIWRNICRNTTSIEVIIGGNTLAIRFTSQRGIEMVIIRGSFNCIKLPFIIFY